MFGLFVGARRAAGRVRFLSFNLSFGPRFEIRGPNKRVDLIFQKSGRPDSRSEKSSLKNTSIATQQIKIQKNSLPQKTVTLDPLYPFKNSSAHSLVADPYCSNKVSKQTIL